MRVAFALPGLHRTFRGAEVTFISVGSELAKRGHEVTLFGSGPALTEASYDFHSAPLVPRERFERFPRFPALRNETAWEEASFMPGFLRVYRPEEYDVTLTCSYPFLNWALRARRHRGKRPAHVFVTQNGDWPARAGNSEYRLFGCDGLICINPEFYEANRHRYRSALIPNGVDLGRFSPGPATRHAFGLPADVPLVVMASALIPSKLVDLGVEAVAQLSGVHLLVAGDGPMRGEIAEQAARLMPGRFHNFTVTPEQMPDLYRSADLFLHLSRDESFGNVYVEAMATGLPTVAWDLPRTRWITADTATLVEDGNLVALASRIADVLQQQTDPAPLTERVQRFSWDRIAEEYDNFLTGVVREQQG